MNTTNTPIRFVPRITMDPNVYLPSTWRDAKGKPLTTARINHYARLGRYGKAMQRAVTKKPSLCPCRVCGDKHATFIRFAYLPQAGWYCGACRMLSKSEHEKTEAAARVLRDRIRAANKAIREEKEQRKALIEAAMAIDFV